MKVRTYIYIDGFNLYYRALKGTRFKWLDLGKLFSRVLQPKHQILSIKYFTARVSETERDPKKPIRQNTWLRAIESYIPEVEIYYGHFLSHKVKAPLATPNGQQRFVDIIKTEEKGSDVNIAVHLLNDAWLDRYDCAIVVSNDSDLAEAMRLVKRHHTKLIGLITPGATHLSRELMRHADFLRHLRSTALAASLLPDPIPRTTLRKPENW